MKMEFTDFDEVVDFINGLSKVQKAIIHNELSGLFQKDMSPESVKDMKHARANWLYNGD